VRVYGGNIHHLKRERCISFCFLFLLTTKRKIINILDLTKGENMNVTTKSLFLISFVLITFVLFNPVASGDQEIVVFLTDPVGDDYGCGSVVYPKDEIFVDGLFDLLSYRVCLENDFVVFELQFREMTNPWNLPNGFSHQLIEILLDEDRERGSGNTSTLYNANLKIEPEEAWEYAIIADGGGWQRHGVKVVESNGTEIQDGVSVSCDNETNTILIRVPQSIIGNPKNENWLHTVLIGGSDWLHFRQVDALASEWYFGGGLDRDSDCNVIDMLKSEEFNQESILANPSTYVALFYKSFLLGSISLVLLFPMGFLIFFLFKTRRLDLIISKFSVLLNKNRKIILIAIALWLSVFSLILRWHALFVLSVQPDEPVYVPASIHYAEAIRNNNWGEIIRYDFNIEHPVFSKLIFSISVLVTDSINNLEDAITACRVVSALFTVGNILLISLINPIAGFLFSVSSWSITYSSVAYLDSPTAFFATVAVMAFSRSKLKLNKYLIISAVATGMGFASKYTFIPVAIMISVLLLGKSLKQRFTRESVKTSMLWGHLDFRILFMQPNFMD